MRRTAIVLACLALATVAAARHRHHRVPSQPGEFSHYVLSLSWSPAFCLTSADAAQCAGPRRFGFIVHGLWPQNEHGWPENCGEHVPVADEVVQSMSDVMPSRALIYHEWSAHGTCSGLEPADFFALVRRAYAGLNIPPQFAAPAQSIEQSPTAVASAFLHANPRLPANSLVVTCSGQSEPRLREVRICLNRDLTPRECSTDTLRGACDAAQMIVPPIR